jgi:hypothetical protein
MISILTFRKTKWLIQNGEPSFLKVNKTSPNSVFGVCNVAEHEISIYLSRNKIADPKWRRYIFVQKLTKPHQTQYLGLFNVV